eukprot:130133-Hanusia_phi.AAC.1
MVRREKLWRDSWGWMRPVRRPLSLSHSSHGQPSPHPPYCMATVLPMSANFLSSKMRNLRDMSRRQRSRGSDEQEARRGRRREEGGTVEEREGGREGGWVEGRDACVCLQSSGVRG